MPQAQHRALVSPMGIIEDQEDRTLARRRHEQLRERFEQAIAMSLDARGHRLFGEVDPPANLGRNSAELEGAVESPPGGCGGLAPASHGRAIEAW